MNKEEKAINQNYIREHNVSVIIGLLYQRPYSCSELAGEIKISDVAVNKIIKQLLLINMIQRSKKVDKEKKIGGQHIRYELNPYIGIYICVDFTQHKDMAVFYDFAGHELKRLHFNISNNTTKEQIVEMIEEMKKYTDSILPQYNNTILSVGLSVPGQVNEANNEFLYSGKFWQFKNDELYHMFSKSFNAHVIMKNNVHLMAIGEATSGKLVNPYQIATYVYLGIGIAACVLFEGKCVTGWRGYAGEIGGNLLSPDSTLSMASSLGRMIEKVQKIVGPIQYQDLFELNKTNEKVHELVIESAKTIGCFIVNASNLVGCNLFMLGGDALQFGDEYIETIRNVVDKHSVNHSEVILYSIENSSIVGIMKLLKEFSILDYYKKKLVEIQS